MKPASTLCLLLGLGLWMSAAAASAQTAPGTPLPPANSAPAANAAPNAPADANKKAPMMGGKMEAEIREKLETLVKLSPQQLDAELQKWPRYQQMDLGERAKLLQRIQEFKERRHKQAENKARELGLRFTPEQFAAFEDKFWAKRIQSERQLWQEMEPRRKQLEQQLNTELKAEFAANVAPPPALPPTNAPAPAPAPAPPAPTTPSPAAPVSSGTTP